MPVSVHLANDHLAPLFATYRYKAEVHSDAQTSSHRALATGDPGRASARIREACAECNTKDAGHHIASIRAWH